MGKGKSLTGGNPISAKESTSVAWRGAAATFKSQTEIIFNAACGLTIRGLFSETDAIVLSKKHSLAWHCCLRNKEI
jgi:hypothetical protein